MRTVALPSSIRFVSQLQFLSDEKDTLIVLGDDGKCLLISCLGRQSKCELELELNNKVYGSKPISTLVRITRSKPFISYNYTLNHYANVGFMYYSTTKKDRESGFIISAIDYCKLCHSILLFDRRFCVLL